MGLTTLAAGIWEAGRSEPTPHAQNPSVEADSHSAEAQWGSSLKVRLELAGAAKQGGCKHCSMRVMGVAPVSNTRSCGTGVSSSGGHALGRPCSRPPYYLWENSDIVTHLKCSCVLQVIFLFGIALIWAGEKPRAKELVSHKTGTKQTLRMVVVLSSWTRRGAP